MDDDKTSPPRSPAQTRRDREAEALRANLRRRKAQQRARQEKHPDGAEAETGEKDPREA